MIKKIAVVAKRGCVCPRENPAEPNITDSEPVSVIPTNYYRRLLKDGSLRFAEVKQVRKKTEKGSSEK